MQTIINKQSREYITKNPIRSSIGAIGYGTVESINLAVDVISNARQVSSLISKSLATANDEAEIESLETQIELFDKKAQLQAKLAKLQGAMA